MDKAVYEFQRPLHARWRRRKELPKKATRYMVNGKTYRVILLKKVAMLCYNC